MSKEKQMIEEMRSRAIAALNLSEMVQVLCPDYPAKCGGCGCQPLCAVIEQCKDLYNAGYRKQSENMVEVVRCKDCKFNVANIEKDPLDITDYSGDDIVCSYFMTDGLEPTNFCSYGAKMKGGAE